MAGVFFAINATAADSGAKDLFYKQQSNPKVVLNTGMQYWIELKRDGKSTNVSNKFAFKTGDSIRIHVKPNTDVFAYIVLKEGSGGEQSILFPDPRFRDNNKLKAGSDYSLPQEGFLTFDQNPGTERLMLILSRNTINASKFFADKSKKPVLIAAAANGSKDLIPGSVVLAYSNQDGKIIDQTNESTTTATQVDKQKQHNGVLVSSQADPNDAVTTLVQKDPALELCVDLALMHTP
ncbi:MAG: DUF4384 domain-containing protein [Candidatus Obscuribacterales bacterium]|nr:DUF4384 domain-containing protein [Candidatus Obscuribacterales bacterium]